MTLTFESMDEILRCDHSNESSLPALSDSAICFSKLYKMKFANLREIFLWLHLAGKGLIDNFNRQTIITHHVSIHVNFTCTVTY